MAVTNGNATAPGLEVNFLRTQFGSRGGGKALLAFGQKRRLAQGEEGEARDSARSSLTAHPFALLGVLDGLQRDAACNFQDCT
ncbi:hypothetical protein D9M69_322380 [compost metagenome]